MGLDTSSRLYRRTGTQVPAANGTIGMAHDGIAPRLAPSGLVIVEETLRRAETLGMLCPCCGHRQLFSVPVDLTQLTCETCGSEMDPMEWPGTAKDPASGPATLGDGTPPINHRLMQRLVATCYRRPEFALKVIEHCRRNWDHAKVQEWGIDKALLLLHAAHATSQRGHGSYWPYMVLGFAFLGGLVIPSPVGPIAAIIGLIAALTLAARNTRNHEHWRKFCRPNAYNPAQISNANREKIERILHFCEATQPRNLCFFGGYEPFDLLGQGDENWSLLVDRRKRAGGTVDDEPAPLDLTGTYQNIVDRLLAATTCRPHTQNGNAASEAVGLPTTRFRLDDIVLVSGRDLEWGDHRFVDANGVPQTELDNEAVQTLASHSDPRYRAYKRIAYYDPRRDLGMLSFLRLAHQGPFTFIESAGTRLLPVVERLMDQYTDEPTAEELARESEGPAWWRRLPYERRRKIQFVAIGLAAYCSLAALAAFTASEMGPFYHAALASIWIAPLLQIAVAYGGLPKFDDDWEPKVPSILEYISSLGLVALFPYHREKEREKRRARVGFAKQTREWDYAPKLKALRVWQSRTYARTRLESTDLLLLRRTNDLAVQEAFLQCLEEAGIDTTDFREGAALINNYGIINQSGRIEGGAKVETSVSTENGAARKRRHAEAKRRPTEQPAGRSHGA